MSEAKQLSESLVGDILIYHGAGFSRRKSVTKIERLTRTQIITKEGKFNRETGYAPRTDSYAPRGRVSVPIDGEVKSVHEENRRVNLCYKLENVKWKDLPIQILDEIAALLP